MITLVLFAFVMVVIVAFGLSNGFLDGGSLISTVVTTRALDPLPAVLWVSVCEVVGLVSLGRAVSRTLGEQLILLPSAASPHLALSAVFCGVFGALVWNLIMWRLRLPSSSSHALLGGLAGAAWAQFGTSAVAWALFIKIIFVLAFIPAISFVLSILLVKALYFFGQYATPAAHRPLRWLHVGVVGVLGMVHGSNNGQKSVGVMMLAATALGPSMLSHNVLFIALAGGALTVGILLGSKRTLETMGRRFFRMEKEQGFCAEIAAACFVGISSLLGYPISTGHTISASIIGAGAALRPRAVRWTLVGEIAFAWILTLPSSGIAGAIFCQCAKGLHHVVS
jgi:inorganic phosphate transporter, PiT family